MKKMLLLCVCALCLFAPLQAEKFSGSCKKASVRNLDIDLIRVDVRVRVDPSVDRIQWSGDVSGHKPSVVEHRETLRFKTVYRGEGSVDIVLPDSIFLESCVARLLQGNITLDSTTTAAILLSVNQGKVRLIKNKIRSGMLNILNGSVEAEINLKRNLSCNFNSVKGSVVFQQADGEPYGIEYVQTKSAFLLNQQEIQKPNGFYGASSTKRKVLFNLMQSDIAVITKE